MKRSVVAAVVAAVAAITVPAAHSVASQTGCAVTSPSRAGAAIAKVVVAADVFEQPGAGVRVWRAATQTPWGHNPTWLLVFGCATDTNGREWLRVLLPIRPNGAAGWIRADFVLLGRSDYSVEVRVGRAQVSVFKGGRLVPQPNADGFVGPWAIHLTGHSDVLDDFGGGPGRIAIHGRGAASLRVLLGPAASHGCIRVDSDVVFVARSDAPDGHAGRDPAVTEEESAGGDSRFSLREGVGGSVRWLYLRPGAADKGDSGNERREDGRGHRVREVHRTG